MNASILFTDCHVATLQAGADPYGLLADAAVAVGNGTIRWVGPFSALPDDYLHLERRALGGRLLTPGLIDCHTHLVFGANRAAEFERRLNGESYQAIGESGGGIMSTVRATRAASDEQLLQGALARLDCLVREGVSTVEIKSGYGLSISQEMRMLRIARQLSEHRNIRIKTSWLACHALPPEYAGRADAYVDEVVIAGLSQATSAGLVDAVDAFCDRMAFSHEQVQRVFAHARSLGLPVKIHAEQFSDLKGAQLCARFAGLSADHLEYLAPADVGALAGSGTVAVMLPGAFYCLGEKRLPPIEALRSSGVDLAVATDCNPGSSPMTSILLAMNMACVLFGLTPEEALAGVTRNAARALGIGDTHGIIAPGRCADFAVWNVTEAAELAYWIGASPLHARFVAGVES